jgi:hypothetical protein
MLEKKRGNNIETLVAVTYFSTYHAMLSHDFVILVGRLAVPREFHADPTLWNPWEEIGDRKLSAFSFLPTAFLPTIPIIIVIIMRSARESRDMKSLSARAAQKRKASER